MQGPMMPRIDALLMSVPVTELQKDDFASAVPEENQGQPPKRRRVIEGRRKPMKLVA